jgi:hypothetical protein
MLLSPALFRIRALEGIAVAGPEVPLLRDVREALGSEPDLEEPVALAARDLHLRI